MNVDNRDDWSEERRDTCVSDHIDDLTARNEQLQKALAIAEAERCRLDKVLRRVAKNYIYSFHDGEKTQYRYHEAYLYFPTWEAAYQSFIQYVLDKVNNNTVP
jgi:hypothetical protein